MNAAGALVGEAPPDRVAMTPEDHANALLDYYRAGIENDTLTPEDFMNMRALLEGLNQLIQAAAQEQATAGDGEMADQPAAALNGPDQPYGETGGDSMPARVGEA